MDEIKNAKPRNMAKLLEGVFTDPQVNPEGRVVRATMPESTHQSAKVRTYEYGPLLDQGYTWRGHCHSNLLDHCSNFYRSRNLEVATSRAFDDFGNPIKNQTAIFTKKA